jgi:hypothetical protein
MEMQRITYLSNGKFLNATIWFPTDIDGNPSMKLARTSTTISGSVSPSSVPILDAMTYGVLVDVDSNPKTGLLGIDFMLAVVWNNQTQTWNRIFAEFDSVGQVKVISIVKDNNQTIKVNNKVPYITLPLDLDQIGSPSNYRVMYFGVVGYNATDMAFDTSAWIDIPPPEYTVLTSPDPIVIRQGDQSIVGLQLGIPSAGGGEERLVSGLMSLMPLDYNSTIAINRINTVGSNNRELHISGGPQTFIVKVSENAPIGKYTIPVLANITTGSLFPTRLLNIHGFDIPVPASGSMVRVTSMTVSVTEPLSAGEQFKAFWSTYGSIISLVLAGFGGAITPSLIESIRNRAKERSVQGTDHK